MYFFQHFVFALSVVVLDFVVNVSNLQRIDSELLKGRGVHYHGCALPEATQALGTHSIDQDPGFNSAVV